MGNRQSSRGSTPQLRHSNSLPTARATAVIETDPILVSLEDTVAQLTQDNAQLRSQLSTAETAYNNERDTRDLLTQQWKRQEKSWMAVCALLVVLLVVLYFYPISTFTDQSSPYDLKEEGSFALKTGALQRLVDEKVLSSQQADKVFASRIQEPLCPAAAADPSTATRNIPSSSGRFDSSAMTANAEKGGQGIFSELSAFITMAAFFYGIGICVVSMGYVFIQISIVADFWEDVWAGDRKRKYDRLLHEGRRAEAVSLFNKSQRVHIIKNAGCAALFSIMFHLTGVALIESHVAHASVIFMLNTVTVSECVRYLYQILFGKTSNLDAYYALAAQVFHGHVLHQTVLSEELKTACFQTLMQALTICYGARIYFQGYVRFPAILFLQIAALYVGVLAAVCIVVPPRRERETHLSPSFYVTFIFGVVANVLFLLPALFANDPMIASAALLTTLNCYTMCVLWYIFCSREMDLQRMHGMVLRHLYALATYSSVMVLAAVRLDSILPIPYSLLVTMVCVPACVTMFRQENTTASSIRRVGFVVGLWYLLATEFFANRSAGPALQVLLEWTGGAFVFATLLASLARLAIGTMGCGLLFSATLNLPPKSIGKYYSNWIFAVVLSAFARNEAPSIIQNMYLLWSAALFWKAHKKSNISEQLETLSGAALLALRGLRLQSIAFSWLGSLGGAIMILLAICRMYFSSIPGWWPQKTSESQVAGKVRRSPRLHLLCGLLLSVAIQLYSLRAQDKYISMAALLGMYGFIGVNLSAVNPSLGTSAIAFCVCGFLTIYSGLHLEDTVEKADSLLSRYTPVLLTTSMKWAFGDANQPAIELYAVETILSYTKRAVGLIR